MRPLPRTRPRPGPPCGPYAGGGAAKGPGAPARRPPRRPPAGGDCGTAGGADDPVHDAQGKRKCGQAKAVAVAVVARRRNRGAWGAGKGRIGRASADLTSSAAARWAWEGVGAGACCGGGRACHQVDGFGEISRTLATSFLSVHPAQAWARSCGAGTGCQRDRSQQVPPAGCIPQLGAPSEACMLTCWKMDGASQRVHNDRLQVTTPTRSLPAWGHCGCTCCAQTAAGRARLCRMSVSAPCI